MNILIDMPLYKPVLSDLRKISDLEISVVDRPEEVERNLPEDLIKGCNILFCTSLPQNFSLMDQLKLVQISSTGYSHVVGKGLRNKEIKVCNARGIFDVPIAEWNISMMINLNRGLRKLIQNQEDKIWDRSARFQKELRNLTVGIWGYGGIGRETARLSKALGLKVHVMTKGGIRIRKGIFSVSDTGDPIGELPDRIFTLVEKKDFLKNLDFLIVAMPLTLENTGIIGLAELKSLPSTAFILNPARGPLIEEKALLKALRENWIAGAALDTHYYYPMPQNHPLWTMENVIMTPHISGSTLSTYFLERIWYVFSQNVHRLKNNESLVNEISPSNL